MTGQRSDLSVPRAPRDELGLDLRRLTAIDRFVRSSRLAELADAGAAVSREVQLDSARRADVRRREHDALVARVHEQLRGAGEPLRTRTATRVVLAHRNAWFVDKVSAALGQLGVLVVASTDNGADAVGIAVAEQPDLVLVEDSLPMVRGEDVVRRIREFCSETRLVAQVPYSDRVQALLDAGATEVLTRQVPPADVAQHLRDLVPG